MDQPVPSARPDGWIETKATIISCKETFSSSLKSGIVSSDGYYEAPDYSVSFRYTAADRTFTGKFNAHSERKIGSTFSITYDPLKPCRNTGTDLIHRPWIRMMSWALAAGAIALALHFGLPVPDYYQPF